MGGGVTGTSTAGGSRPPTLHATSSAEWYLGGGINESEPEGGRGDQTEWEGV